MTCIDIFSILYYTGYFLTIKSGAHTLYSLTCLHLYCVTVIQHAIRANEMVTYYKTGQRQVS